jgi:anti-sigma-K factor RskA
MNPSDVSRDRLLELLADRATQGLSAAERAELEFLLAAFPEVDETSLDRAAATLDLCFTAEDCAPLPDHLTEALEKSAALVLSAGRPAPVSPRETAQPTARRRGRWSIAGWAALAAGILLAVVYAAQTPTAAERLSRVASRPGAVRLPGRAPDGNDLSGVSGEVVWDGAGSEGFLRLRGIPVNDPSQSQYQLWIFDAARKADYPVDGGVFDIPAAGEVIIPIQAKLRVGQAKLFAVTREKPGGVVVSDRKEIVFVAAPPS